MIRVVSETLESNGSSSMGSVCASSMALQAAGVPVSAPVAGVAMGLIKEGDDYIVLTDIAGVEDHLGDMDFKVAGTAEGITALQMDIKITGVTFEILTDALEQANKGRQFILGKMAEAIDGPREQLSQHAPRIESIKIDQEKIGAVIGKGGETIRALCEEFEAEIDVEDDGTIRIYAPTGELVEACVARIESMTKEAEVGDRYDAAKVVKTTTFGAFVELVKGTDGLLHISNVKPGERVDSVDDVLTAGDEIDVTVVEVDRERGRIGLRLSDDPSVEGKSQEELAGDRLRRRLPQRRRPRRPRRPRGPRRPRRPAPSRGRRSRAPLAAMLSACETDRPWTRASGSSPRRFPRSARWRSGSGFAPARATRPRLRPGSRISSSTCCSREPSATRRSRSPSASTGSAPRSTRRPARRPRTCTPASSTSTPTRSSTCSPKCCSRPTYPDIDSEREVVLEEIAMYEDEPQDRVHDILAGAVFGEHPLGPPGARRGRGDRLDPDPRHRRLPPGPLHRRRTSSSAPPATSTTSASSSSPSASSRRAGASERTPAPARPEDDGPAALLREGHRAVPHLLRRARDHPRRRAPLRARRARLDLRRLDLLAALPRGAREARPRLRGRLLQRAVHRLRPGRDLRRHPRGQRRGGLRDHRRRARAAAHASRSPREELARAKENVKGRLVLSSESTAARMTRIARATLFDLPIDSLDEMLAKVDAVTVDDLTELAAELYGAERLSAACVGRGEELLPRRRWRRSARRWSAA